MLPRINDIALENMTRHMGWVQEHTPGMTVMSDVDLTLIDSGLPADTFNVICRARIPVNALRERIERALSYFRNARRPFAWWVGPADRPKRLGRALLNAGLTATESEAAMALDLDRTLLDAAGTPGFRIERARTERSILTFARIVAANWIPPDPSVLRFHEAAMPVFLDPGCPLHLYVRSLDDEPVASAEMVIGEEAVGLYNVCTLEKFRRRGLATALLRRCLMDARSDGRRIAVLQASEEGQRVYVRLGFRVTGYFTEYHPPKE